jgi:hypothetical protein
MLPDLRGTLAGAAPDAPARAGPNYVFAAYMASGI